MGLICSIVAMHALPPQEHAHTFLNCDSIASWSIIPIHPNAPKAVTYNKHVLPGCVLRDPLLQVGPRHDNDHADFTLISVAPTPKEALCEVAPYIPRNR